MPAIRPVRPLRRLVGAVAFAGAILAGVPAAAAAYGIGISSITVSANPVQTATEFTVTITVFNEEAVPMTVPATVEWEPASELSAEVRQCPPGATNDGSDFACRGVLLGPNGTGTMVIAAVADRAGTFAHSARVTPFDPTAANNTLAGTITSVGRNPQVPPGEEGGGGGSPPGGETPPPAAGAPRVLRFSLAPTVFRAASRGPSFQALGSARRRPAPVGATVVYRLDRAARVTLRLERSAEGRRVGGRCLAPTRANRRRPRCARWVALRGVVRQAASAGTTRTRFTGRWSGRRLPPGLHRLAISAAVGSGPASAPRRASFRIVR